MCLYVGNKVALKAKNDIVVYKYLTKVGENKWETPYQGTPVKLNSTLIPNEKENVHQPLYNKYKIESGAIHAYVNIGSEDTSDTMFKAIIKAGTTYYIQDDFNEVAAKELYITDEVVSGAVDNSDIISICKDYLQAAFEDKKYTNKNGVKVGFYRLSNGEYADPLSEFDKSKAIGIVAFFDAEDNPVVMSLETKKLPWLTNYSMKNKVYSEITGDNYTTDFDGKKHTYDIKNGEDYNPDKFQAVEYCVNYKTDGTEKGDWYLGATGEMIKVAQNVGIINASIKIAGVGEPLELCWAWTSSERTWDGGSYAWDCDLDDGDCYGGYDRRYYEGEVRPLAAFINEA